MHLDFARIDYVVFGIGFVGWLMVLALICTAPARPKAKDPFHFSKRYFNWRALHSQAHQDSIPQFLASDEVNHRTPLSKWERTAVAAGAGIVALLYTLDHWGVFL